MAEVVEVDTTVTVEVDVSTTVVEIAYPGMRGMTGPQGPAGQDGESYEPHVHTQSSPSASWPVSNPFGRPVAVTVLNSAGEVVIADVEQDAPYATVSITFSAPTTGVAVLF